MSDNREHDGKIAMMIKLIEVDFKLSKEHSEIVIRYLRDMFKTLELVRHANESKSEG